MSIPIYIVNNKSQCCAEGTLIDHASPLWIKTQLLVGMQCEICHPIIFFYPWSCKAESILHGYLWIKASDGCLLFSALSEGWFHSNSPDHLLRWLIHLQGSDIDEPASPCVRLNNTAVHQSTFSLLNTRRPEAVSGDSHYILMNIRSSLCLRED